MKSVKDTITQMAQDIVNKGAKNEDAGIFSDLANVISAFDRSCFPDTVSPIFAVFEKSPHGYIAQYVSKHHESKEDSVPEGFYIYFTGAHNALSNEVPTHKHFTYDGLYVLEETYTLSDLLIMYGAHEIRHKVQDRKSASFFKNGDSLKVVDPMLKIILAALEVQSKKSTYFNDEKEFDAETIGRYTASLLHEAPENMESRKIASMLKANPQSF